LKPRSRAEFPEHLENHFLRQLLDLLEADAPLADVQMRERLGVLRTTDASQK